MPAINEVITAKIGGAFEIRVRETRTCEVSTYNPVKLVQSFKERCKVRKRLRYGTGGRQYLAPSSDASSSKLRRMDWQTRTGLSIRIRAPRGEVSPNTDAPMTDEGNGHLVIRSGASCLGKLPCQSPRKILSRGERLSKAFELI